MIQSAGNTDIEQLLDKIRENCVIMSDYHKKRYLNLKEISYFEPTRGLSKKIISDCVVSFDVLEHVFISDTPG